MGVRIVIQIVGLYVITVMVVAGLAWDIQTKPALLNHN